METGSQSKPASRLPPRPVHGAPQLCQPERALHNSTVDVSFLAVQFAREWLSRRVRRGLFESESSSIQGLTGASRWPGCRLFRPGLWVTLTPPLARCPAHCLPPTPKFPRALRGRPRRLKRSNPPALTRQLRLSWRRLVETGPAPTTADPNRLPRPSCASISRRIRPRGRK